MASCPYPVPTVVDDTRVVRPVRPGRLGLPTAEIVELEAPDLQPLLDGPQVEPGGTDLGVAVQGRFQSVDKDKLCVPQQVSPDVGYRAVYTINCSPGLGAREGVNMAVPFFGVEWGQVAEFGGDICTLRYQ